MALRTVLDGHRTSERTVRSGDEGITLVDDGNFASGVVIAAFDNRDPLDLEFANRGQQLNAVVANGPGRDFLQLLIRSGQLTVGVGRRGRSAPVVETISLRGSGAAIRSLACIRR